MREWTYSPTTRSSVAAMASRLVAERCHLLSVVGLGEHTLEARLTHVGTGLGHGEDDRYHCGQVLEGTGFDRLLEVCS